MRNPCTTPFRGNQTWLEVSVIAQDLLCWARPLCLDAQHKLAEPKRLRHPSCTSPAASSLTAAVSGSASRPTGPGAAALADAFKRLRPNPALG